MKEVEDSAEKPGAMPPVGSSWHLHAGGPPTSAQVDAALKAYDKVFDGGSRIPPMKAALTAAAEVAAINRDADVSRAYEVGMRDGRTLAAAEVDDKPWAKAARLAAEKTPDAFVDVVRHAAEVGRTPPHYATDQAGTPPSAGVIIPAAEVGDDAMDNETLIKHLQIARAAEREACAQFGYDWLRSGGIGNEALAEAFRAAIRARKDKP